MKITKQDGSSEHYLGRTGLGLGQNPRHRRTQSGYCPTCRSRICRMVAYVPQYSRLWTWAEQYQLLIRE